jgi:methionine-S-sulfoxide reductase
MEQKAYFAGGCFWCTEAIFEMLRGVTKVRSGYAGGDMENPNYIAVSTGNTGHAEAIEVTFNPDEISYKELAEVFFKTHDPTTKNKQGADVGTQYRSVIFYVDETQKIEAMEVQKKIEEERIYENPIVTEYLQFDKFFEAEEDHQNFYKNNPSYGYCSVVNDPKIAKLKKNFSDKLK